MIPDYFVRSNVITRVLKREEGGQKKNGRERDVTIETRSRRCHVASSENGERGHEPGHEPRNVGSLYKVRQAKKCDTVH